MFNDDVYQSSSASYVAAPKEQVDKELNDTIEQFPLLKEVIEYCNNQIALLSSIDAIQIDVTKNADSHRIQVLANQKVKADLLGIKTWIEDRVEATQKQ